MKKRSGVHSPKYLVRKPAVHRQEPMSVLSAGLTISGTLYSGDYKFLCGHTVPIYEILNVHALNQIIGYAKFKNRSFGDVYYRGECKLHESIRPAVFRNCTVPSPVAKKLKDLISHIAADPKMEKQLKVDSGDQPSAEYTIEGMLQHYGIPTRFLDVVDNHWVALWMGLNRNQNLKQINTYNHYVKREIPLVDFAGGKDCKDEDLFQYVLLVADMLPL